MSGREQAQRLWGNLLDLGTKRLVMLGVIGLTVLSTISFGAYYLSQPARETLYAGLNRDDIGRIGSALKDAGINFDVSSDGTAVLVAHAETSKARMLLAEKGLPQSSSSGYELFNELGSFGLTSFMQEVTRVRALEGELARTIQSMKGIKAARVHLVLPERGSFRREQQPASASVVIRTEDVDDASTAQAIRHLVAAAIPALEVDGVTILNTEGAVLASDQDGTGQSTAKMGLLESQVNRDVEENIRRTLAPYLGLSNFEISVAARLNTDQTRTAQTVYDPNTRVERSVRVIKENAVTQNRSSEMPTSVQQNIPEEPMPTGNGTDSNEENQRREELTNYEISSTTTETVRDGYAIEHLSIAVLINKEQLAALAGEGPDAIPAEAQLMEIEQLVTSASGFNEARGDQMKVSAVGFVNSGKEMEPIPPLGTLELLMRQLGTVINAATILMLAALLIWFGLRPAIRAILERPQPTESVEVALLGAPEAESAAAIAGPAGPGVIASPDVVNLIGDLTNKMSRSPQKRLEQMIEYNEEQAVIVLRQWLRSEERA